VVGSLVVVSFRPTRGQSLSRGAILGTLCGLAVSVAALVLWMFGVALRAGVPGWFVALSPVVLGLLLGAIVGLILGRLVGADLNGQGIHPVPGTPGVYAPWQRIEDLRTERIGGRTYVAVCFDTGFVARLRAPYSGRFLAVDPQFERKLFLLRNMWETHRSFTRYQRGIAGSHGDTDRDAREPSGDTS
jgi:hypothetical protein